MLEGGSLEYRKAGWEFSQGALQRAAGVSRGAALVKDWGDVSPFCPVCHVADWDGLFLQNVISYINICVKTSTGSGSDVRRITIDHFPK